MKKKERIADWLNQRGTGTQTQLPAEYTGYFECFNSGEYYEAHDVLEHLWLRCFDENRSFYQALIQFAGAFVHFQKHAQFPHHPTHSRRLAPGARLLTLAARRLEAYPDTHLQLNVSAVRSLCALWRKRSEEEGSPLLIHAPPELSLNAQ